MESLFYSKNHMGSGTCNSSKIRKAQMNEQRTRITSLILSFLTVFIASFMFIGCTVDKGSLENEVKKIMVETMREKGQNLTITKFSLVHQDGNNYEGLAEGTLDGEKIQLDVYAVYDGENIKAEWQPTAAYIQEMNNKIEEETQREIDEQMKEIQKQQEEYQREAEEDLQELENKLLLDEMNSHQMY